MEFLGLRILVSGPTAVHCQEGTKMRVHVTGGWIWAREQQRMLQRFFTRNATVKNKDCYCTPFWPRKKFRTRNKSGDFLKEFVFGKLW